MLGFDIAEVVGQGPGVLPLDEFTQLRKGHLGIQAQAFDHTHLLGQRRDLLGVQLQQQAHQQFLAT